MMVFLLVKRRSTDICLHFQGNTCLAFHLLTKVFTFACAPPRETGPFAERAAVRNRAILWLLYDTGIRVSELINLRLSDLDRKKGVVTVMGKGSKERRIALLWPQIPSQRCRFLMGGAVLRTHGKQEKQ